MGIFYTLEGKTLKYGAFIRQFGGIVSVYYARFEIEVPLTIGICLSSIGAGFCGTYRRCWNKTRSQEFSDLFPVLSLY